MQKPFASAMSETQNARCTHQVPDLNTCQHLVAVSARLVVTNCYNVMQKGESGAFISRNSAFVTSLGCGKTKVHAVRCTRQPWAIFDAPRSAS